MADHLNLTDRTFLRPKKDVPIQWQGNTGSGLIGLLPKAMPKADFFALIKEKFKCGGIRYADASKIETVQKVALCGGSGSFLIGDAIRAGADALVTADITYHLFFDADDKLLLLDIGHYESEQFTIDLLYDFLTDSFPTFALPQKTIFCEYTTNPVRYY
jgi:putative NIF3 family GTP cyclohydrolase 1 type 2